MRIVRPRPFGNSSQNNNCVGRTHRLSVLPTSAHGNWNFSKALLGDHTFHDQQRKVEIPGSAQKMTNELSPLITILAKIMSTIIVFPIFPEMSRRLLHIACQLITVWKMRPVRFWKDYEKVRNVDEDHSRKITEIGLLQFRNGNTLAIQLSSRAFLRPENFFFFFFFKFKIHFLQEST